MSHEPTPYTPELQEYVVAHSDRDPALDELAAETDELEGGRLSSMRIGPEQAALMTVLVRAMAARRALEVGTFTGYGSIAIARGLAAGGELVTCEISEDYAALARRYWERLGLADRIDQRIAPAIDTLRGLADEGFDFAFIDADKESYPGYYEECMRLVRPGGMIVVDNVFWNGRIIGADEEPGVQAIRELNDRVAGDDRLSSRAMIGVADGMLLAVK